MKLLIGFVPFLAFAVLNHYVAPPLALAVGALLAAGLVVRGWRVPPHQLDVLATGTVLLMTGLALYTALAGTSLPLMAVRLWVDLGLLVIVVGSLAIRRPFTLTYARQQVDPQYWNSPHFLHSNAIITAGWAVAFAAMVIADAVMLFDPTIPLVVGLVVIVLALGGAATFTAWYAKRSRHAASAEPAPTTSGLTT